MQRFAPALARAGGKAFTIAQALFQLGDSYRLQMQYERGAAVIRQGVELARMIVRPSDRRLAPCYAAYHADVVQQHYPAAETTLLPPRETRRRSSPRPSTKSSTVFTTTCRAR
jgi:hypothetical protein